MRIRKIRKEDFKQYIKLKKISHKEYSKLIGEKVRISDDFIKKEFNDFFISGKRFLLIIEDKIIFGFLIGSIINSDYKKIGYIDDLFVAKEFRRRGIAKELIKRFIEILRERKIKMCRLGVNIKNENAINFYKKIGFKIKHYEMDKKI